MRRTLLVAGAIVAGLIALSPAAGRAQNAREEIDALVKDYLVRHPEAVGEILAEVLKHRPSKTAANNGASPAPKPTPDRSAEIAGNAAALFSSPIR